MGWMTGHRVTTTNDFYFHHCHAGIQYASIQLSRMRVLQGVIREYMNAFPTYFSSLSSKPRCRHLLDRSLYRFSSVPLSNTYL